jgi:hypothetical protein
MENKYNVNAKRNEELKRAYEALKNYQKSPNKGKGKLASLFTFLKEKL